MLARGNVIMNVCKLVFLTVWSSRYLHQESWNYPWNMQIPQMQVTNPITGRPDQRDHNFKFKLLRVLQLSGKGRSQMSQWVKWCRWSSEVWGEHTNRLARGNGWGKHFGWVVRRGLLRRHCSGSSLNVKKKDAERHCKCTDLCLSKP